MNRTGLALLCTLLSPTLTAAPPCGGGIEWHYGSLDQALQLAGQKSGLALVYFWADGSDYCGKLYQETLNTDAAAAALDGMVCFSAKHDTDTAALFERYSVQTLPTMLVLRADGQPEDIMTGFVPLEDFEREVARIRRAEGTLTGLRTELGKHEPTSEEGLDVRWLLVGKLQELGLTEEENAQTEKIRELDPDGKSLPGAQLRFGDLVQATVGHLQQLPPDEARAGLAMADLGPVYAFARSCPQRTVRFSAWRNLAQMEANRGDVAAAREAVEHSLKDVADENRAQWCNALAGWAVNNAERISSVERKFALELAQEAVALTKKARAKPVDAGADGDGFERSDDALGQRLCVLAQTELLNRKRDKAKKTLAATGELDLGEDVMRTVEMVAKKIENDQ